MRRARTARRPAPTAPPVCSVREEPRRGRPLSPATLWRLLHGLSAAPLREGDLAAQLEDLRRALHVDFAFAAELRVALPPLARAVTVCGPDGPLPTFDYDLDGTPCAEVLADGFHCVVRDARRCFPRDGMFAAEAIEGYAGLVLPGEDGHWMGWLGVMSRHELPDPGLLRAALEVVGARVRLLVAVRRRDERLVRAREELADGVEERERLRRRLDLEARRRARAETEAAEHRQRLALIDAHEGLWDWDLERSRVRFSSAWRAMVGCTSGEDEHDPGKWFGRIHVADLERVKAAAADYLARRRAEFEVEHRILHRERGYRWVRCRGTAVFDAAGRPLRFAGSQADVHEQREIEERLAFEASHDPLTGLANRRRFVDLFERRLGEVGAGRRRCAVLILDLDRFTRVNDGRGRAAGDELLRVVADRLLACVGAGDTVARLAGDEFAVLLGDVEGGGAAGAVADRILAALAEPFPLAHSTLFTGGSIGIAVGAGASAGDLVRQAEIALHRAKENGRGRWELFDAVMHKHAVTRLQTELDLRWAIERDELWLAYQPVFELGARRAVGVEALLRWQHPTRGAVGPETFVPVAEETGLILPLGAWVLSRVARELDGWPSGRELTVAVNLSVRQLRDPGLLPSLRAIAPPAGSPLRLRLEITESALMDDPDAAALLLRQVHELGISVAIDDFGTGYSSLAHLLRLPVDALKIDRAFVRDLDARPESRRMVAAITELAHELDLQVVAEGVERESQLLRLAELGVDQAQGYLLARPLERAQAVALLGG